MIRCDDIIVSDASGPLPSIGDQQVARGLFSGNLNSPRLFDIASDQIRSLRSRLFVQALTSQNASGALIKIGNSVRDTDDKSGSRRDVAQFEKFQTQDSVLRAYEYPTNLSRLSSDDFELIARHGFECADATLNAYRSDIMPRSISWKF